jgi:hypothetical protein
MFCILAPRQKKVHVRGYALLINCFVCACSFTMAYMPRALSIDQANMAISLKLLSHSVGMRLLLYEKAHGSCELLCTLSWNEMRNQDERVGRRHFQSNPAPTWKATLGNSVKPVQ